MFSPEYIRHYKKTLALAYPVCVSQLGHMMVGVVDTAMVGQIGPGPQAAVALANSLYVLVLVFGLGVSVGVTPLVASAHARGDKAQLSSLLKHSFLINTILGILLFLLLLFVYPCLNWFGQQDQVLVLAVPFLNVMMMSMIPLGIYSGLKQFAEGLSDTRTAMFITIGANLVNILLNWLLIFGHWGFPAMGLMGSCWGSFIARVMMAIAMYLYVYRGKRFAPYRDGLGLSGLSKDLTKKILSLGIPSGMQSVFELSAFSFAVIMIGWIGVKEQAAHQVALSLAAITYMIASGLSSATSVRVSNHLGLNDRKGSRQSGFTGFFIVAAFMGCMALVFVLARYPLTSLFTKDLEVLTIAASLMIIAAFFQLSDGLQVVALGALRGLKDVNVPTVVTLIAYWVIGIPCCYLFGFTWGMGVHGVWYGLSLSLFVVAVTLVLRFHLKTK